ncbi:MAG: hypothetical protein U0942_16010 [Parvibaculum sp.]|uniref:hypothetical protein n=1 Tax=Parvibaculum sp. TaxID=2024848 RepID=UPI002AB827FE|nr:hypothetical protein [Parvibaculum sp.]MDZ4382837.1 hypothetical protein [Parvibaculum sp.]
MRKIWKVAAMLAAAGLPIAAHAGAPDAGTYEPYSRAEYPKTFATWGEAGIRKVNEFRKKAAFKASAAATCDEVAYADVSDNRSRPPSEIVIFVDCNNGQRFYFDEAALAASGPVLSETEKTAHISDKTVLSRCREELPKRLQFPSSYDPDWFGESVYRAPVTGRVVAQINFEAKNGIGNTIPQTGRCIFDASGLVDVEIANR